MLDTRYAEGRQNHPIKIPHYPIGCYCYDFIVPCACGCCAPCTVVFLFLPCGCCVPGYIDTCFPFSLVTLTDTMRSLDSLDVPRIVRNRQFSHHVTVDVSASRASGSLTHMFPVSVSRDFYDMRMSHGDPPRLFFVMLMFSCLCFLLISGHVDSS